MFVTENKGCEKKIQFELHIDGFNRTYFKLTNVQYKVSAVLNLKENDLFHNMKLADNGKPQIKDVSRGVLNPQLVPNSVMCVSLSTFCWLKVLSLAAAYRGAQRFA